MITCSAYSRGWLARKRPVGAHTPRARPNSEGSPHYRLPWRERTDPGQTYRGGGAVPVAGPGVLEVRPRRLARLVMPAPRGESAGRFCRTGLKLIFYTVLAEVVYFQ